MATTTRQRLSPRTGAASTKGSGARLATADQRDRWRQLMLATVGITAINGLLASVLAGRPVTELLAEWAAMAWGAGIQSLVFRERLFGARLSWRDLANLRHEARVYGLAMLPRLKFATITERLGVEFWQLAFAGLVAVILFGFVVAHVPETNVVMPVALVITLATVMSPEAFWSPVVLSMVFLFVSLWARPHAGWQGLTGLCVILGEGIGFAVLQTRLKEISEFIGERARTVRSALRTSPTVVVVAALVAAASVFQLVPEQGAGAGPERFSHSVKKSPVIVQHGATSRQQAGQASAGAPRSTGGHAGGNPGASTRRSESPISPQAGAGNQPDGGSASESGAGSEGDMTDQSNQSDQSDQSNKTAPANKTGHQTGKGRGDGEEGAGKDEDPVGDGSPKNPAGKGPHQGRSGHEASAPATDDASTKPEATSAQSPRPPALPKLPNVKLPQLPKDVLLKFLLLLLALAAVGLVWFLLSRKRPPPATVKTPAKSVPPNEALAEFRQVCQRTLQSPPRTPEELRLLVVRLYNVLLDFYGKCGHAREPHVTPDEFAGLHYLIAPTKRREMVYVTALFYSSYYGKQTPSLAQVQAYVECIDQLGVPFSKV